MTEESDRVEGTEATTTPTAAEPSADFIRDHAARAASIREQYAKEANEQAPEADDEQPAGEGAEGEQEELQPSTTLEGAAARAAEREKRMAAYREKEQAAKAAREHKRKLEADRQAAKEAQAELERVRAEARKEREARERLEAELRDPAALFALAEKHRIPPEEWGAYLGKINDPASLAADVARKVTSPEIEAVRKELAELRAERERERMTAQERAAQEADQAGTARFLGHVREVADDAPLANAYLKEFGDDSFAAFANDVFATHRPRSAQELIDLIETDLERLGRVFGAPATRSANTAGHAAAQRNSAAAKANTLTNRDAQARFSVTEEAEDWQLSVEDRVERIKRRRGLA